MQLKSIQSNSLKTFITNYRSSQTKIMLLRHAQSVYNQFCDKYSQNQAIQWSKPLTNDQFCANGAYNLQLMDSGLSQAGKSQCIKTKQKLDFSKIDLVLVSPMLRTLQTCNLVFSGIKIPILVEPLLSQAYRYSCDIVPQGNIAIKKVLFPEYNFKQASEDPEFCYNVSQTKMRILKKHCEDQNITIQSQKYKEVAKLMRFHQFIQSDTELKERVQKLKIKLNNIIKTQSLRTVAIVSHWHLLICLRAKKFGPSGQILWHDDDIQNCEPYYHLADQIINSS